MVVGHLIAGMGIYGGLGWLVGTWLGNVRAAAAIGVIFGMAAATYLIYLRVGRLGDGAGPRPTASRGTGGTTRLEVERG